VRKRLLGVDIITICDIISVGIKKYCSLGGVYEKLSFDVSTIGGVAN